MKTKLVIIAIIILLSCLTYSYSQDQNIEQLSVIYNNRVEKLCDTLDGFKGPDHQLLRGFQWGNNRSASQALYFNQNSIKLEYFCVNQETKIFAADPEELQDNAYVLISDPRFWSGTLKDTNYMHSHSMTFEPNLKILPTYNQDSIIHKRPYDPNRPVFGFTQIHPLAEIPTLQTDPDYSFLKINNPALINQEVFSDPWGSEYLFRSYFKDEDIKTTNLDRKNYQGYNYCVSVNLKRLGPKFTEAPTNAPVLEIKLPYTLHNDTLGYIKFDSKPDSSLIPIITTCWENRGQKTWMVNLANPSTSFIITQDMLPSDYSTVTVTARFRCWGRSDDSLCNPRLSTPTSKTLNEIRKLERAVTGYFDYIEDLVERENTFTMEEFSASVNEFLAFRKYNILRDKGKIMKLQADQKAEAEYDEFNKTQKIISDFDKEIKKIGKKGDAIND
ncbi:MAG: RhuM family protein [bacterium]